MLGQLDYAYLEPRSQGWFAMRTYFEEVLEAALRGKMTAQQALDAAAERFNRESKK